MNLADQTGSAMEAPAFRVLYVGPEPVETEQVLTHVETPVGWRNVTGVSEALELVRELVVDCVIVDQRRESNQAALLTARLAADANVKNIVVLTSPESSAAYEALGVKCHVLFFPVKPVELIEAVFANQPGQKAISDWKTLVKKAFSLPRFEFSLNFSRAMIPLVSFIYKNTALVLLAALFAVFVSYGVMIVFFMLSSSWAAPLTLSQGHELVIKAEQKIGELKVKQNLVRQRISKEERETRQAKRAFEDAGVLANLVAHTIDEEFEQRLILQKDLQRQISQMTVLKRQIGKAANKNGVSQALKQKFNNRLINRKTYDSSVLAVLELKQREVAVQRELAAQKREVRKIGQSLTMLESLRFQIQQPEIKMIKAANAEFVPLANQVITVKTSLKNAKSELASHTERLALLQDNAKIIQQNIQTLSETPLARAAKKPVVVLFTPYENGAKFKSGRPLYSCRFGVVWCVQVGKTGRNIEGEVTSVHPFFGKNIRGSFVEAFLTDKEAAKKEVLHVGRPPLFF